MSEASAKAYSACPVCQRPGRFSHALWPAACAQCGERLMYSSENTWIFFLKTWGALPFILLLVERKPPVWQGAVMGVGIYLLVNLCLWLFCVGFGRPQWFFGQLQKYSGARSFDISQVNWKRLMVLFFLIAAGLFGLYLLMRVGLSYSPIGRAN